MACCIGCAQEGFTVGGKVAYPDGSPVTRGQVTLMSNTFTGGGQITADGTYNINVRVPAGTYQVTVRAVADTPSNPMVDVEDAPPVRLLVHSKYNRPETSELAVEVTGRTTFDITVTAPQ